MANLWEITQLVKSVVLRPDLDTVVDARIVAAVKACHAVAPCLRDRREITTLVGDPLAPAPATIGTAPYDNDFRTLETITAYDADGKLIDDLGVYSATEIIRRRKVGRDTDTAYVVGNQISFKCRTEVTSITITGYVHAPPPSLLVDPNTGQRIPIEEGQPTGNYTDWLLESYEVAAVDYAIGYIETLKGNRELANTHLRAFEEIHKPYILALASGEAGT